MSITNKEMLYAHPLEYSIPNEYAQVFRNMITRARRDHDIDVIQDQAGENYTHFSIVVPRIGFANSYAHIGAEYRELIIKKQIRPAPTSIKTP